MVQHSFDTRALIGTAGALVCRALVVYLVPMEVQSGLCTECPRAHVAVEDGFAGLPVVTLQVEEGSS